MRKSISSRAAVIFVENQAWLVKSRLINATNTSTGLIYSMLAPHLPLNADYCTVHSAEGAALFSDPRMKLHFLPPFFVNTLLRDIEGAWMKDGSEVKQWSC